MKRQLRVAFGVGMLAAGPGWAEDSPQAEAAKPKTEKTETEAPKDKPKFQEEVTVVSGSKTEETLVNSPATISLIGPDTLATTPSQNVPDVLRSVPGLNVIQTSARDFNLTSRQATATLSNGELVLVDGRSVYLDFFGLVLWDFIPNPNSDEVKQIEVVRGPASMIWGANALNGVVNIITKSPRDAPGFGVTLTGGTFNRDGGSRQRDGNGYTYGANFFYASAPAGSKWSYKLSAGYLNCDPYSRPEGFVPAGTVPLDPTIKTGGAPYPPDQPINPFGWVNRGTSQPKFDLRVDQEVSNGGHLTYQGGYSGTGGIIHTGIGPFDIQDGANIAYGRVQYTKDALRLSGFSNFLTADAPNQLQIDPATGQLVQMNVRTQTYDLEVGNSNVIGQKTLLVYGGNARRSNFDITLAPNADSRNEFGAYAQAQFTLAKLVLAAGARVDKFSNIASALFSPRVSLMFKPTGDQSIRLSYNRAFRAPSVINNYLDQDILSPTPVDLRPLAPFLPPSLQAQVAEPFFLTLNTFGNTALTEEHIDAFELAYTAALGGKTTISLAVYRNDQDNNINFTYLTPNDENPAGLPGLEYYSVQNPAQGITAVTQQPITLSPVLMGILAALPPPYGPVQLPWKVATYLNLGPIRNQGIEMAVSHRFTSSVNAFVNYSWQDTPQVLDPASGQIRYPAAEVTVPPKNRFNAGVSLSSRRYLGNLTVNYADRSFWNDVLNEPYWGWTDAYTMVNATVGMRFADGKVQVSLRGTNLFNQKIQQHIYGDILRRAVVAELRFLSK